MRREFIATVDVPGGDMEIAIVAEQSDHWRWHVKLGERVHDVDAREIRPGVWSLLCEGRSYLIDLDRRRQSMAILHGTSEVATRLEDARRKKLAQAVSGHGGASQSGEVISAPIAGKVVKLSVSPGDEVTAGQSVGVLEAMKMENEIKAERGGKVEALHVSPGQSVETGDRLITLV